MTSDLPLITSTRPRGSVECDFGDRLSGKASVPGGIQLATFGQLASYCRDQDFTSLSAMRDSLDGHKVGNQVSFLSLLLSRGVSKPPPTSPGQSRPNQSLAHTFSQPLPCLSYSHTLSINCLALPFACFLRLGGIFSGRVMKSSYCAW